MNPCKGDDVAKAKTLLTTPYGKDVMQRVQRKIFVFSRHFPCYNRISVTTNIKNSSLLVRNQDGNEVYTAAQQKLRSN